MEEAETKIDIANIKLVPLSASSMEDVALFKCSDQPVVEQFLKEEALKLEECDACKTMLFYYEDKLVGFYTLFSDYVNLVKSKRKSEQWADVTTAMKSQHFPSIRLHFLGVHDEYRGKGLGEHLLMRALNTCIYVSDYIGFNFIVLEALENAVGFFEKYLFSKVKKDNDLQIMAIRLKDIKG